MPIDPAVVGRRYPAPTSYVVSREKVRDFALAIGDPQPLFLDPAVAREAGYDDVVAPPTFLTVLGFRFAADGPLADPAAGVDYSRVVHGDQRFVLHRPVVAGDVLDSVQVVDDVRAIGAHEKITVRTEVTDAAGTPVATLTSSAVVRGVA